MARYRGDVSSPRANDLGSPTSLDFRVDLDGKVNRDVAKLNTAEEPLEHAVLNIKLTELQEPCRRLDVAALLSMIDVTDFAAKAVTAVAAGNTSFNDALRGAAEFSEL